MKRTITLFALIAAMSLVVGCKKKPKNEAPKADDTMAAMADTMDAMDMNAMDMAAMDMAAMDMAAMDMAAMAAGGADSIGIPECDEYIKLQKCYLSKVPAAAKAAAEGAFNKMVKTWKDSIAKSMGAPAVKAATAKGCKMAVDMFKKTAAKTPYGKGCVK